MRVFTRIIELQGFARAGESLQLSPATVTTLIKQLEAHLGVQLLQRTTRQVTPTRDGMAYYERCVRLLADLDETEAFFSQTRKNPQGKLRVDLPGSISRLLVMPSLPQFCERYPGIELIISSNDRPIDLIREGVDCVLRAGAVLDESLVARPLTKLAQVTCASPGYLEKHGIPRTIGQLEGHCAVNYISGATGRQFPLEFQVDAERVIRELPGQVSVNGASAYVAACEAGLGLIQAPLYVSAQLAEGRLCEVLPACRPPPLPLSAAYPPHRQLSSRVRVFVDWLAELFGRQA